MSDQKYPFPCFYTGRTIAEGDADQLREYFAACGMGEPFDEDGSLRYPLYHAPDINPPKPG